VSGHSSTRAVCCRVTERDIDEMIDYGESGMADVGRANAIALALRRCVKKGALVEAKKCNREGDWAAYIDGKPYPLPDGASRWMGDIEHGLSAGPLEFMIALPRDAVAERPQSLIGQAKLGIGQILHSGSR